MRRRGPARSRLVRRLVRALSRSRRERESSDVLVELGESLVAAPDAHTVFGTGLYATMALAEPIGATGAAVLQLHQGTWEVMQATGSLCAAIGRRLAKDQVPPSFAPGPSAPLQELRGAHAQRTAAILGVSERVTRLLLAYGEVAQEDDATIVAVTSAAPFSGGTRARIGIVAQQIALAAALDRSRQALVRSERLAAIGQLAATVSHELRNPLAAIRNAVAFLRRRMVPSGDADRVPEFFDIIEREVKASNRIVTELLDFARGRPLMSAPVDVRDLVEELRGLVPLGRCALLNEVPADLPPPMLDRDQMRQVLANLVQNAADAAGVERDGEVTVRARVAPMGTFVIEVEDDGPGMPPEVAARAFEPLFTTKRKGTGLGLSIVAKNVAAHGGEVRLEERAPNGTRFVIEIPPAD
ncbi:MAG: ATP-binding protein [Polyangiaceae bacterium]